MENPHWGPSPWKIDYRVPRTALPERCEVAVVGAGFVGLATACALARRGLDVVVLEADRIGQGASGRTGGIVLEGTAAGEMPDARDCISALQSTVAEAGIDCGLRVDGCHEIAHTDEAEGTIRWRDAGKTICVQRKVPGGTVDPGALVAGLARAAIEAGVSICERSPVVAVVPGDPLALRASNRRLAAERVVLAVNAFTTAFLAQPLRLPVPMHPALTLAVRTAPLSARALDELGITDGLPFYTVDLPYLWGRLDGARLILGAGLVFPDGDDVRSVGVEQGEVTAAFDRLEQRIRAFHPALAAVEIEARWGGPIAFREGRTPLLGRHPQAPDVIVTGAYAGHGIALSAKVGELIAEAITSNRDLPAWGTL